MDSSFLLFRFAERLVNKANGMELLASRRKVIQQLTNLQHTLPVLTTQFELEYQPLSKKHLETALSSACGLVSGSYSASQIYVTVKYLVFHDQG